MGWIIPLHNEFTKQLTFAMHIKPAHYSLTTQNAVYTGTKCIEIALRCEHLHFVIVFSTKTPTLYVNKLIYLSSYSQISAQFAN